MPSLTIGLVSILSVALFLGLAVLGWGGFGPFFANPARVSLVVVTIAMLAAGLLSRASLSSGEREDRGNRWVIAALGAVSLLAGFLPAFTDRMEIATLDGDTLRWIGVAVYAIGGVVRLGPVFALGSRFSGLVAIQPGHQLLTTGFYAVIRHPSYLGILLICLGWALAFRSIAGIVLALTTVPILIARIEAEERLLAERFGAEYEAWRARTWRMVPGVW